MKQSGITVAIAGAPGGDETESRSLLQAARTQVQQFGSTVGSAVAEARQAAEQNTGSKGSKRSSSSQGSDEDGSGG